MNNPRAIIYDDEPSVRDVLRLFLEQRGYEVLALREPLVCPVYGEEGDCKSAFPCADILITDYDLPRMNGCDLLSEQIRRGCKQTALNKAIMSGYFDEQQLRKVCELGCAYFEKPLLFAQVSAWLERCERRMEPAQRIDRRCRDVRHACEKDILCIGQVDERHSRGRVVNQSGGGLCLKIAKPLKLGQAIVIRSEQRGAYRTASVRWVRRDDDGQFLAGLDLVQ